MMLLEATPALQQYLHSKSVHLPASPHGVVILGSVIPFALAAFIWAVFFRRRRRHRKHRHSRAILEPAPEPEDSSDRHHSLFSWGRRRHRRRHKHRQMNPTLAQTGGLPPPRSDEPPSPAGSL